MRKQEPRSAAKVSGLGFFCGLEFRAWDLGFRFIYALFFLLFFWWFVSVGFRSEVGAMMGVAFRWPCFRVYG